MGDVSRDELYEQHVERRARAIRLVDMGEKYCKKNPWEKIGKRMESSWMKLARATMEADRAAGLDPFELKAALERAEVDRAAMRVVLENLAKGRASQYEVDQALTDHPGGKMLDVVKLLEFWFEPWGAWKTAHWEDIAGDRPYSADAMLDLMRATLERENV